MKIAASIFKTLFLCLCIIANTHLAYAQTASILPQGKTQFLDNNGKPLTSGTVDFYIPSTTTRKTTWQNSAETIANANPVVLDAGGRAIIYGDGSYRQVVKDRNGNTIWDQVTSSTGSGSSSPTATGDGDLVGTIKPWAGMTAPNQYVFAYGQEVSRTTYSVAFTALTSSQPVFCNSGSPILSGLTDTTNFWVGMSVEVSCVAAGFSTVVSKSSSSITLAANANVTTNTTAVMFPWGRGNGSTTFNIPDYRGLIPAGNNNMGGVPSANLTTTYFGATDPNSTGALGGAQSVVLITGNLPPYTPAGTITNGAITTVPVANTISGSGVTSVGSGGTNVPAGGGVMALTSSQAASIFAGTAQGGTSVAFSKVPPSRTTNYIVKIVPDTNSATASGVTDIQGMTGSIACGSGMTCTGNIISSSAGIRPNVAIYATDYGVTCDGVTDDAVAAQAAIAAAAGRKLIFPAGTCVIGTTLTYNTSSVASFTQGLQIEGQGLEKTLFDNRIANGYLFDTSVTTAFTFQAGIEFSNFQIMTTTSPVVSSGIRVNAGSYAKFSNIFIKGMTNNGFSMPATAGDADAAFMVKFENVRVDIAGGWCYNFYPTSGGYFGSQLTMINTTGQRCGTASAAVPPTSGGLRFDGQVATLINSGFTINNNVDLYIAGPDTSVDVTIIGGAFENHISSVLPHIYVDGGLRGFKMYNSQCLNNDSYVGRGCVWLDTTTGVQGDIILENIEVRATTGNNNYQAFVTSGTNAITHSINVKNVYWQLFDAAGQTRFSGFEFEPIDGQAKFLISGVNTALVSGIGYGFVMPMKLGTSTSAGEWVPYQVPSAGVSLSTGVLTPLTSYNFYLYNSAATNAPIVGALEVNTSAPTSAAPGGYFVKTGDYTRLFVGSATTDAGGNFQTTSTQTSHYPAGGGIKISKGASGNIASYGSAGTTIVPLATLPVANGGTGATSITSALDTAFSSTQGAILYRNATVWTALTPGTAGQFLTTQGAAANPNWSSGGAGTGTVTSVTPGTGLVSGITTSCDQTAITASGTLYSSECINAQTGTSYAIVNGDRAKLVTASNAAAQAYTLAQAGAASAFQNGWYVDVKNNSTNAAGIVTITPTTSTIDGAATLVLRPGRGARISSDGTNYQVSLTGGKQTLPTTQVFTSGSGTYTTPANVQWIEVDLVGGGGGGAGAGSAPGNGGNGGDTTFSTLTGSGGVGAVGSAGGAGGASSGGFTNKIGGAGGNGSGSNTTNGGAGGISFYGSAGNSGVAGGGSGVAAGVNSGSGGGGGGVFTTPNGGGGGGSGGYVKAIINSPAASYSYGIGAAGTAGTAGGGSGGAGGAGGSGYIQVIEHYNN